VSSFPRRAGKVRRGQPGLGRGKRHGPPFPQKTALRTGVSGPALPSRLLTAAICGHARQLCPKPRAPVLDVQSSGGQVKSTAY